MLNDANPVVEYDANSGTAVFHALLIKSVLEKAGIAEPCTTTLYMFKQGILGSIPAFQNYFGEISDIKCKCSIVFNDAAMGCGERGHIPRSCSNSDNNLDLKPVPRKCQSSIASKRQSMYAVI